MWPELGKYAVAVLGSYAVALTGLGGLIWWSLRRSARVRAELARLEAMREDRR